MKKKHTLRLSFTAKPIRQPVTKFGGQPVWVEAPQWPVSPYFGEPMLFLGQVALDPALFGGEPGRMAYFFITDPDAYGDLTPEELDEVGDWDEPFDGENAVIIQPGGQLLLSDVEVLPMATGPGLVRYTRGKRGRGGIPVRVEFSARAVPGEDPDDLDPATVTDEQLHETKLGGTPALMAEIDYDDLLGWTPILQVDLGHPPFDLNLDPFWVMHGLLSPAGTTGALVVQNPYMAGDLLLPDEVPAADDDAVAADDGDGETWAVEDEEAKA